MQWVQKLGCVCVRRSHRNGAETAGLVLAAGPSLVFRHCPAVRGLVWRFGPRALATLRQGFRNCSAWAGLVLWLSGATLCRGSETAIWAACSRALVLPALASLRKRLRNSRALASLRKGKLPFGQPLLFRSLFGTCHCAWAYRPAWLRLLVWLWLSGPS